MSNRERLLDGKRVLVTGGSRNLGRALCLAFARAGARVAFTYHRRTSDADETAALLAAAGVEPLVFQGSVADAAHVKATVDAVSEAWGGLDVLVSNAAVTQILPIALLEEPDWDEVMDVNVKGAYLYARAALKPMIRARRGHILCVGSFGADRVVEAPVHYAASKAALVGFAQALAKEVGRYGLAVNVLVPGLLDGGLARRLPKHRTQAYVEQCALGRLGQPEEIAELAVWLVSDENSFMTGARVIVDGGL
jgi:NAD(P)-dependent dehydrogenase (short-subunit alcohol dehydrogenase family)